jgi:arginyl-tRNA synthetase
MPIREKIESLIQEVLDSQGMPKDMVKISLDHPADQAHGDYSTNVAMVLAKSLSTTGKNPLELAEKIADGMRRELGKVQNSSIQKIEVAKPGFINFYLSPGFFINAVGEVLEKTAWYGKNRRFWNKKIIIEHTNFNPYKPVHIGHLVNNAIGESLSRILEFQDAKLTRVSYGGDVGLHVAKALWGIMAMKDEFPQGADLHTTIEFIGKAYALGTEEYEINEETKKYIHEINKKVYDRSDPELDDLYIWGKNISVNYFNEMCLRLDSRFDAQFFESEVAGEGKKLVEAGLERNIFEKSQGAVIFPGEKYGLHNRVFITSQGLPTYEAKELGLTKRKFQLHDFDQSIIITANEQNDYFKVVLKAIEMMFPEIATRTLHFSHGMMRFALGKMSSRKGNVITAESFIGDIENLVLEKIKDRELSIPEQKDIADKVAIAAMKYSILKQSIGKDIIFDAEKSVSFEGDSGPYLQYAYVRTQSILAKAKQEGIEPELRLTTEKETREALPEFVREMHRFPDLVARAADDFAPNYIATYLIELASAFNNYYAHNKIIDRNDPDSPHKVALTQALGWILKNGLYLLGIQAPDRM